MRFESLNQTHANQLLAFELKNKAYFESVIASREDAFYSLDGVSEHISDLLNLKGQSLAYSYVLVENDCIIARANIKEIQSNRSAEIGYRVAENFSGKGIGSLCVEHLVNVGINKGLNQLVAFVINNNPASEKVLLKNGFELNMCIPKGFIHKDRPCNGFRYLCTLVV